MRRLGRSRRLEGRSGIRQIGSWVLWYTIRIMSRSDDVLRRHTIHGGASALVLSMRGREAGTVVDIAGVEAVEVEEVGIGEEVKVIADVGEVGGEVLGRRRDGVEAVQVLGDVGRAAGIGVARHGGVGRGGYIRWFRDDSR